METRFVLLFEAAPLTRKFATLMETTGADED